MFPPKLGAMFRPLPSLLAALGLVLGLAAPAAAQQASRVRITTNLGAILVELDAARAPATVKNFLAYVRAGHYDRTIFHRVKKDFMIQGGGMTPDLRPKPTRAPIRNEADNGLKNLTGTIAMARTPDAHSATDQFFINTFDNAMLDHRGKSHDDDWGYAVFGKVVEGMDTVRRIEALAVYTVGYHEHVPRQDAVIEKAEIVSP